MSKAQEDIEARVAKVPIPSTPPSAGDWIFLASLNEGLLDKEFTLANHRMSWTMTSQSILLGAFCLVAFNKDKNQEVADMLLKFIPLAAWAIVLAGLSGIIAAQIVIYRLEHERSYYQAVLRKIFGADIPDIGSCRQGSWTGRTRFMGFVPSIVITSLIFLLWSYLLLSRLSIGIKFGPF